MAIVHLPSSGGYSIECPPTILPNSTITLCGESPGWHEVKQKEGFVGGSGNILRSICRNAGVDFDRCNRTNVAKRRPPSDNFGVFYQDPQRRTKPTEELIWWRELLVAEISRHRPNVVVALGAEPTRALVTTAIGISKWAGSILESDVIPGLKVIPMFHPAFIMRDKWEYYYVNIRYMRRVAAESTQASRVLREAEDQFVIQPTIEQVLEFLSFIQTSGKPWYLDVETRGDTLSCFGLSSDGRPRFALCVPVQTTTGPYWSVVEEARIWRALSLSARDNPLFRNQNCVYDLEYLLDHGVEPSGIDFDPMIGMNNAFPEFPKGLDFQTAMFTYYPYYKDEGRTWKKKTPDIQIWTYNCKDMVATPKTSNAIIKELNDAKLYDTYRKRCNRFLGIALEMQRNRLRLDREWHRKLSDYLETERIRRQGELNQLIGREINVKSSPQVQQLLYEELRLPQKKKRGSDNLSTDEKIIRELRAQHPGIPHLNLILMVRHLRTKQSNYINLEFDKEGEELYLPYQCHVSSAKTGRWAYTESPKWRGSSPQTVPKVMRLMYIPPEGSVFWQRDLSQAEARVVAWLSNCKFLLDTFANGRYKIHQIVAANIFKDKFRGDPSKVIEAEFPQEYDIGKRTVHAYDYMMSYKTFAISAAVPYDFAQMVLDAHAANVPEIADWWQEIKNEAITKGRLVTPMGRVRQCYKACSAVANTGQLPDEILRDLVSYIPQSTVPDVLNEAMYHLWQTLSWVRWHQQGHDSYLCSGDPRRTSEMYERSESAASAVHFSIRGRDCHIPGEFQWGYSWGAMVKYIPGEDTSREAWLARATKEKCFDEGAITKKLYSLVEEHT